MLDALNLEANSDDFVFDNQIIVQALAAGARIGELSCPTSYHADASSINFRRSMRYGLGVLKTSLEYRSCPTSYHADASSINFRRSMRYGLGVLKTSMEYRSNKSGLKSYPYLEVNAQLGPPTDQESSLGDPAPTGS